MGDISKLKIALGQIELVEGQPSRNEKACDAMIEQALDAGADALVVPNSLVDEDDVKVIGLNDTRIDVAGNVVVLDARGDTFRIGLGRDVPDCDFTVRADLSPYTFESCADVDEGPGVVVKPVGIRDLGKKVLAFAGGSKVVGRDGYSCMRMRAEFEEDFGLVDFSGSASRDDAAEPTLLDALVSSLRRFDAQALPFSPRWVVGLSGGLDSSITAALLVLALGSDRVVSYNMATRYNTQATKDNAASIADALGIEYRTGSIEGLVVSMGNTLVQYGYPNDALKGLVLENVQARTRGNLLQTFAAVEGGVVVNNGNRIECALGYATLYGDAIGAFAPIADVTKVQLFDVARQINERFGCEVVPENLLPEVSGQGISWETPPSAELASDQRDPMKWFYHDWLISQLLGDGREHALPLYEAACEIISLYADTKLAGTDVESWVRYYGLDDPYAFAADLEWVVGSMRRSVFKRIQSPPMLALASRASVNAGPESQVFQEPTPRYNALMRKLTASRG